MVLYQKDVIALLSIYLFILCTKESLNFVYFFLKVLQTFIFCQLQFFSDIAIVYYGNSSKKGMFIKKNAYVRLLFH